MKELRQQLQIALDDLNEAAQLGEGDLLVVGTSTSEVIGEKIGSGGSEEVADALFAEFKAFEEKTGAFTAFQGCEHINRALVLPRQAARQRGYDEVSVIPHTKAGGSMCTHAYHHGKDMMVVENVRAEAGIDIGDTLIGMHLKPVAVPVRSTVKTIGDAHVTMARTRPKLIGGVRATYA
ncbi:TIGR01440 family protein [Salsuginibacillus kocurii]|uniref:TIGR01440 family protein n=1 Tax=Salsuginibacillus kocurii TaxID=427078 RepID=UPI0004765F71|nr:TIGR01440 family protein [Salsuginibacillus kocurii]